MDTPSEWWNGFFEGLMADFWQAAIPEAATREEVDFFQSRLGLAEGSRVLDAPCGHGRHSLELARRGCRVTGLDRSRDLLAAARAGAKRDGLAVDWVHGDMRSLPWTRAFDAVVCAGNSFGFFDDAGNQAFLDAAATALPAGGRFLLDWSWIAESLLPNFNERLEMETGSLRFTAQNRYVPETGLVESLFTASRGTDRVERPATHRVYTHRQLLSMLRAAGFHRFQAFGSTAGEPFRLGSHRLLLLALRAEDAPGP